MDFLLVNIFMYVTLVDLLVSKIFTYMKIQQNLFDDMCFIINGTAIVQKFFGAMCTIINGTTIDNGAHGTKKLLLNTQISEDFT